MESRFVFFSWLNWGICLLKFFPSILKADPRKEFFLLIAEVDFVGTKQFGALDVSSED